MKCAVQIAERTLAIITVTIVTWRTARALRNAAAERSIAVRREILRNSGFVVKIPAKRAPHDDQDAAPNALPLDSLQPGQPARQRVLRRPRCAH